MENYEKVIVSTVVGAALCQIVYRLCHLSWLGVILGLFIGIFVGWVLINSNKIRQRFQAINKTLNIISVFLVFCLYYIFPGFCLGILINRIQTGLYLSNNSLSCTGIGMGICGMIVIISTEILKKLKNELKEFSREGIKAILNYIWEKGIIQLFLDLKYIIKLILSTLANDSAIVVGLGIIIGFIYSLPTDFGLIAVCEAIFIGGASTVGLYFLSTKYGQKTNKANEK